MSWIQDVQKLAQTFLTLDDLVFGQELISESLSQVELAGRQAVGSVVVGSNVAARTFQVGMQAGAKATKVAAQSVEGFVPGAGTVRAFAERVDHGATEAAEEASRLASYGVELARGGARRPPANPVTGDPWLAKSAPREMTLGALLAETATGPLARIAALPFYLGADGFRAAAATRAGGLVQDAGYQGTNLLMDLLPGTGSTSLDTIELRELLAAVASGAGEATGRDASGFLAAAVHLAAGDGQRLRRAIEEGVLKMRLLAEQPEVEEILPGLPLNKTVRRLAREIAQKPPKRLAAALGTESYAGRFSAILAAFLEDFDATRTFAVNYPIVLSALSTGSGALLGAGLYDAGEIERYVRSDDGESGGGAARPWSVTDLETFVGQQTVADEDDPDAVEGLFPASTVWLAQDVSFSYSSHVLGRQKALERMERIFGDEVRERVEADLSLDSDVMGAARGSDRDGKVRDWIAAVREETELCRLRDRCGEQLESLQSFAASPFTYRPRQVEGRIEVLSTFLSLTGQQLALASDDGVASRVEARQRFADWADGGWQGKRPRSADYA